MAYCRTQEHRGQERPRTEEEVSRAEPANLADDLMGPPKLIGRTRKRLNRRGLRQANQHPVALSFPIDRGVETNRHVRPAGHPLVQESLAVVHAVVRLVLPRSA